MLGCTETLGMLLGLNTLDKHVYTLVAFTALGAILGGGAGVRMMRAVFVPNNMGRAAPHGQRDGWAPTPGIHDRAE